MIETERLILRPWSESEAEELFKYASDPDIGPIAGWNPHSSVDESLEIIRTVFTAPETYAVVLKSTGKPVGSCGIMFSNGLHSAEMGTEEGEIGYWIGKPFWGQGIIPEAVMALLHRSFDELKLQIIRVCLIRRRIPYPSKLGKCIYHVFTVHASQKNNHKCQYDQHGQQRKEHRCIVPQIQQNISL